VKNWLIAFTFFVFVGPKNDKNRHADTKSHEQVKMAKQPSSNCLKSKRILQAMLWVAVPRAGEISLKKEK
jgi:hypothetical protein